jgi:predicted nucleic acid-binding protein
VAAKVLLDTDILSEVMKGKDPVVVAHARPYLARAGRLSFSAMTVMEVVAGYSRRGSEEKLRRFLQLVNHSDVAPIDAVVAELAGRIHADLARVGLNIGVADTIIAATTVHMGIPLVTGNTSDYARVQDAGYPLQLRSWRDP